MLKQDTWRTLHGLLKPCLPALTAAMALMFVERLLGFVLPLSTKILVDDVLGRSQVQWLLPLLAGNVLATGIQAGCTFGFIRLLTTAGQTLVTALREAVYAHICRLPLAFYDVRSTGALVTRIMADVDTVRHLMGAGLIQFAGSALTAVFSIVALAYLEPVLTAALVPVAVAYRYAFGWTSGRMVEAHADRARINAEVSGRLTESLAGIRVVKTYQAEEREAAAFAVGARRLSQSAVAAANAWLPLNVFTTTLIGVTTAVVTYVCARRVLGGGMTLGDLVVYTVLLGILTGPVLQLVALGGQFGEMLAGMERIQEILREPPEDEAPARVRPAPSLLHELRFTHVSFQYAPGVPALADVSFVARPGTLTALVGPSGAGKSTIVALVGAFYSATTGEVSVDGVDLSTIRLDTYRRHLSIALQDVFLFSGTIRDNILFARPDARADEVLDACRVARVSEFAERLPHGYGTVVGERGMGLSGGQRQRIAIARAVLARPRLLLLDEATSSLDSESEIAIHAALERLTHGCITLLVAHRLSTVVHADQILVLDGGRIVERGTHESLVGGAGWYARTYRAQQGHSPAAEHAGDRGAVARQGGLQSI